MNWLVIGIGDLTTKRVIPAILEGRRSALYGVVTRDIGKAAAYPGVRAWTSLDEALTDPAIDAVYVASPVVFHAEHTLAALRAGKHVLCEKPVAMNYPQAQEMAEAGRASDRLPGVAYFRRLFPKLIRAKQLIAEGAAALCGSGGRVAVAPERSLSAGGEFCGCGAGGRGSGLSDGRGNHDGLGDEPGDPVSCS
jgi:predicted dehydrogenase